MAGDLHISELESAVRSGDFIRAEKLQQVLLQLDDPAAPVDTPPAAVAWSGQEQQQQQRRARRLSSPATAGQLLELTPRTKVWEEAAGRQAAGELEQAELLYRQLLSAEPESTELVLYHLGVVAEARGDLVAADDRYGEAEQRRLVKLSGGTVGIRAVAEGDQLLLRIRMGIVGVMDELGHMAAAEALCGQVATAQEVALGADHPVRPLTKAQVVWPRLRPHSRV